MTSKLCGPCLLGTAMLLALPGAAQANDEAFEFWLSPSVEHRIDKDTSLALQTGQRFRSASDGRADTYLAQLWVRHKVTDNVTIAGGIEQRENDGGLDEIRAMQQLSASHGILRTRLRLEQRWVEDQSRMGWRLRPALGTHVPLGGDDRWALNTNAELFWTLRSSRVGPADDPGLTGLRTQVGVSYRASDKLALSLSYLRNQEFIDNAPDRIGHAPLVGIAFSF